MWLRLSSSHPGQQFSLTFRPSCMVVLVLACLLAVPNQYLQAQRLLYELLLPGRDVRRSNCRNLLRKAEHVDCDSRDVPVSRLSPLYEFRVFATSTMLWKMLGPAQLLEILGRSTPLHYFLFHDCCRRYADSNCACIIASCIGPMVDGKMSGAVAHSNSLYSY